MATEFARLCAEAAASIDAGSPNEVARGVYDCFTLAGGPRRAEGWEIIHDMLASVSDDAADYTAVDFAPIQQRLDADGFDGDVIVEESITIVEAYL